MADRIDVMISSTARDLPIHRQHALDACLRQGMFPIMMEHLPPKAEDAIAASLKMVDDAEIYLGIFAYRYGFLPPGHDISITEMEYNRAVERGIPRLIFFMHKEHQTTPEQMGEGLEDPLEEAQRKIKLAAFKKRLATENIINEFKNPDEFRALVVNGLSLTDARTQKREQNVGELHSAIARQIPTPPEPYIAHRYSLLETRGVIGRQAELNLLTGWITGKEPRVREARILSIVAVGGMGKSALTWKWFNEIAPNERPDLKGRLWWSFYESDAGWENFILRALAYVRNTTEEALIAERKKWQEELAEGKKAPYKPWDDQLFDILDKDAYLLALDGLERILIAYARMDAAHLHDDEYDQRAANYVAGAIGLPEGAGESFVGQVDLRKCADPRAGALMKRLASLRASRILITTRLYPAELQMVTGAPLPGCGAYFLKGLTDDDAVNLWREFGVTGTREELLKLFASFENYPLLIRALAGEVARFKRAPGDFDAWRKANPGFNPYQERLLTGRKSYVLGYALTGLTAEEKQVLETVAAFRMPATYDTLVALLASPPTPLSSAVFGATGEGEEEPHPPAPSPIHSLRSLERGRKRALFETEAGLDAVLNSLEERGLVGWDRNANRYDLHPIVRGVTWSRLGEDDRRGVYSALQGHFAAVPDKYSDYKQVERFEDLTPAVELYQALIGLGRYEDAYDVFRDRLDNATHYRLSASRQRIELLEPLFPDGTDHLPRLARPRQQSYICNALALAYDGSGEPGRAAPLYRRCIQIDTEASDQASVSVDLGNLADALRLSGSLREAEAAARRALVIDREREDRFAEADSLNWLGLALAACGQDVKAVLALKRAYIIDGEEAGPQAQSVDLTCLAQAALWRGQAQAASLLVDRAWELATQWRTNVRDFIRAARLQGAAALGLGDFDSTFDVADERLHHALGRARAVNLVEQELPALVGLAELARRRGQLDAARELLSDVWEPAKRGPYPLFQADAFNELAAVERAAGHTAAAIEAATQAYTYAWCDGISADGSVCYAYAPGLRAAKAHLDALGTAYPVLPPFDESQFEPLPAVEINPKDRYWVDPATVEEI